MSVGQPWRAVQCEIAGGRADWVEIRSRRLVEPVHLLLNLVFLPKQAADRADAPVIGRAQAKLVALMCVPLDVTPGRTRGEALRRGRCRAWIGALIVINVGATRVVRIVLDLLDVAHQVSTGVDGLDRKSTRLNSSHDQIS